jgi:cation transport ATPase
MAEKEKKSKKKHTESDEKLGKRFGKRMKRLGEKFDNKFASMEERFTEHEERRRSREERQFGAFGLIWPFIKSIFTIVVLAFLILVLDLINAPLKSYFISQVSDFLLGNLYLFFAFSLFFAYARYLRRRSNIYWVISPVVFAMGVAFLVWILVFMLDLISFYAGSGVSVITSFLRMNFLSIFIFFMVLGYAFEIIKRMLLEC